MGQKFDLVATSKKKGYRITMLVLIIAGLLLLGGGLLLRLTVTDTVTPNRLTVSMPGLTTAGNAYATTISTDTRLNVNTGTGGQVLDTAIYFVFTYPEGTDPWLEAIEPSYRCGLFWLRLKKETPDGATAKLTIICGSLKRIEIDLTYSAPQTIQ